MRTRNNSPALNHFLEDVLNAQNELKWIDRVARRSANPRDIETVLRRYFFQVLHFFSSLSIVSRLIKCRVMALRIRRNEAKRAGETFDERRSDLGDELKTKREVEGDTKTENSQPSLASLKRTIIELSNSLNPRESFDSRSLDQTKTVGNEERFFDGRRKLLSSQNVRSAMGIAIEYYDYEEDNDPVGAMINRPAGREVACTLILPLVDTLGQFDPGLFFIVHHPRVFSTLPQIDPENQFCVFSRFDIKFARRAVSNPPTPAAPQIPGNTLSAKKNEFAEEEKKEELKLQNLKNKVPKEEFISNVQGPSRAEEKPRSVLSNSLDNSPVLRRIAVDDDSDSSDESRW